MESLVLLVINLGLAWSVIAYVAVLSLLVEKGTHGPDNGAVFYILSGYLLPVLLLWWLAFGLAVWRGAFDSSGWSRNWQYGWVVVSCFGLMLLVFVASIERKLPLAGLLILPVMTVLAVMLVYRVGPLPWAQRGFLTMSVMGILVMAGCAGYVGWQAGRRQVLRIQGAGKPDGFVLSMVQDADPVKNFGSLLNFSSRHTHRQVRALALEKIRSLPDWETRLQSCLRNGHHMAALVFLRDNPVPDPGAYAEGVREAIRLAAEEGRAGRLYPPSSEARKVREVAEKWAGYGVDLSGEVAELERVVAAKRDD